MVVLARSCRRAPLLAVEAVRVMPARRCCGVRFRGPSLSSALRGGIAFIVGLPVAAGTPADKWLQPRVPLPTEPSRVSVLRTTPLHSPVLHPVHGRSRHDPQAAVAPQLTARSKAVRRRHDRHHLGRTDRAALITHRRRCFPRRHFYYAFIPLFGGHILALAAAPPAGQLSADGSD